MYSLLFLGLVSFVWSLLLTPVVRAVFRRWSPCTLATSVRDPASRRNCHRLVLSPGVLLPAAMPLNAGFLVRDSLNFALRLMPAAGTHFPDRPGGRSEKPGALAQTAR